MNNNYSNNTPVNSHGRAWAFLALFVGILAVLAWLVISLLHGMQNLSSVLEKRNRILNQGIAMANGMLGPCHAQAPAAAQLPKRLIV